MTSRERVIRAINHQQPDRPPIFTTLTPQAAKKLSTHYNLPYEEPLDSMLSTRISHMDLLTHMGNDCVGIAGCAPNNFPTREIENNILLNEWGMKFVDVGIYFEFYEYPLAHATTIEDIKKYPFPDPLAEGRFDNAKAVINKYKKDYAIVADLETVFFETSWYLVGMEKLLTDMALGEEYIPVLFDKVMEVNVTVGKKLIEMGADILWAGDDFGSQNGMLIAPEMWRMYFKPRIKEMFQEFRSVNSDIKIAWHSCGSIVPIIPDFIEIGLDILNPIQPLAKGMTPEYLKGNFGNELTFFGGIDIQDLLPNSTPDEIAKEVKRRIQILGKNGGYIIAPAHNIQDDTPIENIEAFFEAAKNPYE
jgi:uroporphyrinogen decarboxylase